MTNISEFFTISLSPKANFHPLPTTATTAIPTTTPGNRVLIFQSDFE